MERTGSPIPFATNSRIPAKRRVCTPHISRASIGTCGLPHWGMARVPLCGAYGGSASPRQSQRSFPFWQKPLPWQAAARSAGSAVAILVHGLEGQTGRGFVVDAQATGSLRAHPGVHARWVRRGCGDAGHAVHSSTLTAVRVGGHDPKPKTPRRGRWDHRRARLSDAACRRGGLTCRGAVGPFSQC